MSGNAASGSLIATRSTYFGRVTNAVKSIFEGLSVTLSYLLHKPITIQYPDKTDKPFAEMLPERFRGELELRVHLCSACLACARACPIECITIEVVKDPETKKRMMTRFDIDISKCMYCGLCTEPCPTAAIHHTHKFEGSAWDLSGLMKHFVTEPVEVAKVQKKDKEEE
jgi:formate hydrogenlyase subunit 6/NADH:ubiquinone oxidoreductase subunit I